MRYQGQWQRWATLGAAAVLAFGVAYAAPARACTGDCDGSGEVSVDKIIKMVNIANNVANLDTCAAGDSNGDGAITVEEIIQATNIALGVVPCSPPTTTCGNRVVEAGEDCDDGGICIGGNQAGSTCTAEADCGDGQPGVCDGGTKLSRTCDSDSDCDGAKCVRCKTFGGDDCAANCTTETSIAFNLVPGVVQGLNIKSGTSGSKLYGDVITELPLPLTGQQTLTIGKEKDGQIPGIIKAASVQLPKVPISNIACACVRGAPVKTCGGTLFLKDGSLAKNCTDNIPLPETCTASDPPCTFVNGPGNSASGLIGCNGLTPVNADMKQDCNPETGGKAGPPVLTLSGTGPNGSVLLLSTLQIGTDTGVCKDTFCTAADPVGKRGNPTTFPFVSGATTATAFNISDLEGNTLGPHTVNGAPFVCSALTASPPNVSNAQLAGAYTSCDSATVGDVVNTSNLVAQ